MKKQSVTWYNVTTVCPICKSRVILRAPGGFIATGQDSDLLLQHDGNEHIIQIEINICGNCKYAGFIKDFKRVKSNATANDFRRYIKRKVQPQPQTPDGSYFYAYHTGVFFKWNLSRQAEMLLRAYWCMSMAPSSKLPTILINDRCDLFLDLCKNTLERCRTKKPIHYYLLGEISRRSGFFEDSIQWFEVFLAQKDVKSYLKKAAEYMSEIATNKDSEHYTMEQVFENKKG